MAVETRPVTRQGSKTVFVDRFCDGIIGPSTEMLGPVRDGGHIVANTAPGCWGPMITPVDQGRPRGDAAGRRRGRRGRRRGRDPHPRHLGHLAGHGLGQRPHDRGPLQRRPLLRKVCRGAASEDEATVVEGIGPDSVRCANCGAPAAPFAFTNGYTIAFDDEWRRRRDGRERPGRGVRRATRDATPRCPENSVQNPILLFAPHDLVGVVTRAAAVHGPARDDAGGRPARLAQRRRLRRVPARRAARPRRRAGAARAPHRRPHGHRRVPRRRHRDRPVKVPGGGVYLGDMHAMQGDGEIAGHTCDVSGTVTLQVEVLKGLTIDGPIILPVAEDLPFLARPLTGAERTRAEAVARRNGVEALEDSLPISVVGTGPDLNSAVVNGLERAAALLDVTRPRDEEPRDDHGRHRDRPRSRRRAGDLPRAGREARCARP